MQTKEQRAAYDKARYPARRDKLLAQMKTHYVANRQQISAKQKADYAANRDKHLARQKSYRDAHSNERLAYAHKRRAQKLGVKIGDAATIIIWLEGWRTPAPFACHYCRAVAPGTDMQVDHVVPMSKGGDHDVSNLVVCCSKCNKSKKDKLPEVWLSQINL